MKSVLLIGLGRFGRHMAAKLQELHHEVLLLCGAGGGLLAGLLGGRRRKRKRRPVRRGRKA